MALTALPGVCAAVEERSLLTADGTLHVVRAGLAVDLGVQGAGISPQSNLIEWTARAQDGTVAVAVLPGTVSYQAKHGLELAYDDQTASLLLLWTEDVSAFSQIRVGVLRDGTWTNSSLLPSAGTSRAHNPQMLVTHRGATYLDSQDNLVVKTSSILSVVWFEEAGSAQARYATLFLDETNFDPTALADLRPARDGGHGRRHPDAGHSLGRLSTRPSRPTASPADCSRASPTCTPTAAASSTSTSRRTGAGRTSRTTPTGSAATFRSSAWRSRAPSRA